MAVDTTPVGSVGHLVGAALETAGHYMQANMLDALSTGAAGKLVVLIFVCALIAGITTWALSGEWKVMLWVIIGPPLFLFLTQTRVPSSGAAWRYGAREYNQKFVEEASRGLRYDATTQQTVAVRNAEVSWFFKMYNRIISGVMQGTIATIELMNQNANLKFITFVDRYDLLFRLKPEDPKLIQFLNSAAVNKCTSYYLLLQEYYKNEAHDGTRQNIKEKLELMGKQTMLTGQDYPQLKQWLIDMGVWDEVQSQVGAQPSDAGAILNLNCNQLWTITLKAFSRHVQTQLPPVLNVPGLDSTDVRQELQKKFATNITHPDTRVDTLTEGQKFMVMVNEVSARMILRELKKLNPNLAQLEYGAQISRSKEEVMSNSDVVGKAMRVMQRGEEYEEKGDYFIAVLALPYVQGMILYFLALCFPFFAMTLLIPGKHGGVLLWCGLWLWAKLWDVGFAIVMLIDRILFILMPHGPALTDQLANDPGKAIKALLEVDPTYSTLIYYNLLATCMAAVPIVTGFLVKKSGGDLMSLVSHSLTTFSGRIGQAMASYERAMKAQSNYAQFNRNVYSAVEHALDRALKEDPIIQTAIAGRFAGNLGAATAGLYGFSSAEQFNGFLKKLAASSADHRKEILNARLDQIKTNAFYNEAYAEHNRELAREAIRLRYNSHDFVAIEPVSGYLGMAKAYANFTVRDATQSFVTGGFETFRSTLETLPPAQRALLFGTAITGLLAPKPEQKAPSQQGRD